MAITIQYGTATISATTAGPGGTPNVTVSSTGAGNYADMCTITSGVKDLKGDISIVPARVNATQVTFSASRQLPAGTEIVFNWTTLVGTTV